MPSSSHVCGDFASQRGVAGRSRMPSARAERGRSSFPPPGCGRHPPGCGPVRCLCVSNLHAERFLVAFAVEAALATWNPGLCPPDEAGVGQHRTGSHNGGGPWLITQQWLIRGSRAKFFDPAFYAFLYLWILIKRETAKNRMFLGFFI